MSNNSGPSVHASVLQFLINHGYKETIAAFRREARQHLDLSSSEDISESQLVADLSKLQIQRYSDDLIDGDGNYFSKLTYDFDDIHYNNILAVAVNPHTHAVATSSVDKTVKVSTMLCKTDAGISQRTYRHHTAPVLSIDFHPSVPHLLLTTSMDGSAVLVDTAFEADFGEDVEKSGIHQMFKDHKKYVVRGLFSPNQGKFIATASYDRTVCIYAVDDRDNAQEDSLPNYKLIKQLGPFIGNVETICFVNETTLVIGVRDDNYLHYINLENWQTIRVNMNATGDDWVSFSPLCLSVSPDGSKLLCTTDHQSGRTILFQVGEAKQLKNYYINSTDNKFATKKHVWHPSGLYFYASGNDDNSISVVEIKTGRIVATLSGHKAMIRSLTLSNDIGLISTGFDNTLKVWSKPMELIR
ncbi:WD40-repeat-containing domain protein [Mycotypha africana]|uniref:WD40-repeat-containing domain protein n=1 Tax=Mycotypha africana TaxID=64632 RepID=UPI0023000AC6|nr:WD40-repeat-containing domain protein [Mycotypha africana]KAI8987880.1 WD40-repeat-containing domain protein [Mycotypha africana]